MLDMCVEFESVCVCLRVFLCSYLLFCVCAFEVFLDNEIWS